MPSQGTCINLKVLEVEVKVKEWQLPPSQLALFKTLPRDESVLDEAKDLEEAKDHELQVSHVFQDHQNGVDTRGYIPLAPWDCKSRNRL